MEAKKRKKSESKEERVRLTSAMRSALDRERLRTGLTPYSFAVKQHKQLGTISYSKIQTWLSGRAKTIYLSEYQHVLTVWKELPDREPRVRTSPELLALLRAERERTNASVEKLLAGRADLPEGLTARQARRLYDGMVRWIPHAHFEYLLQCWKALPDCQLLTITPEIAEKLRGHMDRTGKGPAAILRGAKERPEGLNAAVIHKWLCVGVQARKDHVDYVMQRYAEPDDKILVPVTVRHKIQRHIRRSGVSADMLLRQEGLITTDDPTDWSQWPPSRVSERDLLRMLAAWEALPDKVVAFRRTRRAKGLSSQVRCVVEQPSDPIAVTPEMVAILQGHIERTGMRPVAMLRQGEQKPESLTSGRMSKLLLIGAMVSKEHWDHVLGLYTAQETRTKVPQRVRDQIRRHIRRTGVGPNELLRKAEVIATDDPRDWSKWPKSHEREADLATILTLWERLPDRGGPHRKMASAMPRNRKKGHKRRLQSEELELRRHYLRFLSRVQRILPLPEKHIVLLFEHLHGNGGQLPETIRDTDFAGLTSVEVQHIERAYMVSLLEQGTERDRVPVMD